MLLDDRLKRIEQQKRIAQIKSKKILFTNPNPNQNPTITSNIQPSKNNLRMMNFR